MIAYCGRRLAVSAGLMLGITVLIYGLVRAAPGNPVEMLANPFTSNSGSAAYMALLKREFGFDQSLPFQYFDWLKAALSGNLGYSYVTHQAVTGLLWQHLGPTLLLMGSALLLAILLALPLGCLAAVRRNTALDSAISVVTLGTLSIPSFFLGFAAIYIFSFQFNLLPSSGMTSPGGGVLDVVDHLVLPASVLGLAICGPFVRYVRGSVIDELHSEYVRTAEAKGASPTRIVVRHALRNALIPLITIVAIAVPQTLAGAVITEQVFSWPGMGQLALNSIQELDYPVIIGFTLYVAVLVIAFNFIADILYMVVDPRVKRR